MSKPFSEVCEKFRLLYTCNLDARGFICFLFYFNIMSISLTKTSYKTIIEFNLFSNTYLRMRLILHITTYYHFSYCIFDNLYKIFQ